MGVSRIIPYGPSFSKVKWAFHVRGPLIVFFYSRVSTRLVSTSCISNWMFFATGIVREHQCVGIKIPVTWVISHIRAQRWHNRALIPLNSPIILRIVCGFNGVMSAHNLAQDLEDLWGEALAVVLDDVLGSSVIEIPSVYKTFCDFCSGLNFHRNVLHKLV